MKFLLDVPVSRTLGELLRSRGHDAEHAYNLGLASVTELPIAGGPA